MAARSCSSSDRSGCCDEAVALPPLSLPADPAGARLPPAAPPSPAESTEAPAGAAERALYASVGMRLSSRTERSTGSPPGTPSISTREHSATRQPTREWLGAAGAEHRAGGGSGGLAIGTGYPITSASGNPATSANGAAGVSAGGGIAGHETGATPWSTRSAAASSRLPLASARARWAWAGWKPIATRRVRRSSGCMLRTTALLEARQARPAAAGVGRVELCHKWKHTTLLPRSPKLAKRTGMQRSLMRAPREGAGTWVRW
eukprot:scaffold17375_cov102-Isochrysis_galbana.AAC.7